MTEFLNFHFDLLKDFLPVIDWIALSRVNTWCHIQCDTAATVYPMFLQQFRHTLMKRMEPDLLDWAKGGESFVHTTRSHDSHLKGRTLQIKRRAQKIIEEGTDFPFDDWFLYLLRESRAVVAGSFPLSILLGQDFAHDIDIFHNTPTSQTYLEHFMLDYTPRITMKQLGKRYGTYTKHMEGVREYITPHNNIFQCIAYSRVDHEGKDYSTSHHIHHLAPTSSIINATFDMDICKVMFDGRSLNIPHLSAIIARTATIKTTGPISTHPFGRESQLFWAKKRQDRSHKYAARGFKIHNLNVVENNIEQLEMYYERTLGFIHRLPPLLINSIIMYAGFSRERLINFWSPEFLPIRKLPSNIRRRIGAYTFHMGENIPISKYETYYTPWAYREWNYRAQRYYKGVIPHMTFHSSSWNTYLYQYMQYHGSTLTLNKIKKIARAFLTLVDDREKIKVIN